EERFKKAGLKTPDNWEDLYKVGRELKKMGNPVGIPISQNFDSISTGSAVMWCYGAREIDKDGKTVKINAPQTVEVIEWYKKMYRDCMEAEVLSWTSASMQSRSEEHTSELQSLAYLVCRLLLEKKK